MFLGTVLSLALAQPSPPPPTTKGEQSAVIVVKVPPTATVFIGTQKMTRTGSERYFSTPPLPPGRYSYEVLATWDSPVGLENTSTKTVVFSPGETVTVDFLPPPPPSDIKVLPKKLKTRSALLTDAGSRWLDISAESRHPELEDYSWRTRGDTMGTKVLMLDKKTLEETLRSIIRRKPFVPFVVVMDDGQKLLIPDPVVTFCEGEATYLTPDYEMVEFGCEKVAAIRPAAELVS